ncbi:low temperature requirement protein A [Nocardia stercoris]|uniref:Low temperature requirement protein A n=1 Tax=Nocardia stercoris TaxID=2483361 RepID=A0A3M2KVF4_9NOCA|nr:low temperature requirement protein A [Nocardia stercoris]RMI28656.1 low temperature requirement protein A [Nocardia stercoris]
MTDGTARPSRPRLRLLAEDASVTELELFFDLVLVFAFTQVDDLAAHHTTAVNMLRALLVLAVMWWVWIGYAWLGNVAQADVGLIRLALFSAMGAGLIVAVVIPEAFEDMSGGLHGPLVFALAYLVIRLIHLVSFWVISAKDPQLRRQVTRWSAGSITIGTTLLIIAAQAHGTAQIWWWIGAVVGDMGWTLLAGNEWRLNSAGHFAERHGLIVIVALGESIVSIGMGVAGLPVSWPIIAGVLLALSVSGLLWSAYFDAAADHVEKALKQARGPRRVQIARNCYTYWHFPMVVGIVALALGSKKVMAELGGTEDHALTGIPLLALYGGPVLYLLALIGFRHYATGVVLWARLLTAGILVALTPLAWHLPALGALALLAAVLAVLISWERWRYPECV